MEIPTKEKIEWVRSQLKTNDTDIKVALTAIRLWMKQQPHLPQVIDDGRLERMYINCKCSMERTKRMVDAYYSLKTRLPDFLMNRVLSRKLPYAKFAPLPKLTPDGYRVWAFTTAGRDVDTLNPVGFFRRGFVYLELMLAEDYSIGDIGVYDLRGLTMSHLMLVDFNVLMNVRTVYQTAYSRRYKAVHLISNTKAVEILIKVLKQVFPEKLQERIFVHEPGSDTLFDAVPKECLPEEIGGTAGNMDDVEDGLADMLEKYKDWLLEQDRYVSDESKRPEQDKSLDERFGVSGSFKKLIID